MPIFLSLNNTKPYNTLVDLRLSDTFEISTTSGAGSVEKVVPLYIIASGEVYPNIEVKVENENSSGASLYISPLDGVGNPTHWGKILTLSNLDGTISDAKVLIKYKWVVINNIYILKRQKVSGNINIYGV